MARSDPRKGFVPVGAVDLRAAGLAAKPARRLRLDRAWAQVAGDAIGRRATVADIRRGVLEIEIGDPSWARELRPLLPRLVARIAREFPDLGIKKFRTTAAGATVDRPSEFEPDQGERSSPASAPPRASSARTPADTGESVSPGDLLEVATQYLERARARRADQNRSDPVSSVTVRSSP